MSTNVATDIFRNISCQTLCKISGKCQREPMWQYSKKIIVSKWACWGWWTQTQLSAAELSSRPASCCSTKMPQNVLDISLLVWTCLAGTVFCCIILHMWLANSLAKIAPRNFHESSCLKTSLLFFKRWGCTSAIFASILHQKMQLRKDAKIIHYVMRETLNAPHFKSNYYFAKKFTFR